MVTRLRTRAACDKAAIASLRPFRMVPLPDMRAFERFPKLTPDQQARADREWEEL